MKYFILRGYLPQPAPHSGTVGGKVIADREERIKTWRKFHEELPKEGEHPHIRIPGVGKLSAFVYNVYDTLILITAASQKAAYSIASPFRAFCV